jgi:hypothetical protein
MWLRRGSHLIAWTRATLFEGDPATAEPAQLRYRLLYVAARIACGQRRAVRPDR